MIIAMIIFVATYAYQLFSWEDLMPITLADAAYMLPFTITHIISTLG